MPLTPGPNGKILLVCASQHEASCLHGGAEGFISAGTHLWEGTGSFARFDLLVTGVGITNTALQMGKYLAFSRPSLAINFGIGGAFAPEISNGTVVEVVQDCFADLGADSPEGFLSLDKLGFPAFSISGFPFYNVLTNPGPSQATVPKVSGITVNTVSGSLPGIHRQKQLWNPQVESMEGAAFFQACLMENISFAQFRAISNRVEPRNRGNWNIPLALENLGKFLSVFLSELNQ